MPKFVQKYLPFTEFGFTKKTADIFKQFIPFMLEFGAGKMTDVEKNALEYLYLKMPRKSNKPSKKRGKNFLIRRDFLIFITTALNTCSARTHLRNAVLLGILCLAGLRVFEAIQIQVGDFVLDENGLLKDDGNGFGRLILPDFKSKGGYSPSIEDFDIAIVPNLRQLINMYLKSNFMDGYTKDTYLFRKQPVGEFDERFDVVPSIKKELAYASWAKSVTKLGQEIVDELYFRCKHLLKTSIKGTVSCHDFRRSGNNWIKDMPSRLPSHKVHRIAEIHLRHKKSGGTNEERYTAEPKIEEYIECINNALNFPWDLKELEVWEGERMLTDVSNIEDEKTFYPIINNKPTTNSYSVSSCFIEEKLTPRQKRINELKDEIENIKRILQNNATNRILLDATLNKFNKELRTLEGY